jgi:hypothetical protein
MATYEGAPTAGAARGLPAGSTAAPGNFVKDSFNSQSTCPRGGCGAYRGVARGGGAPSMLPMASMRLSLKKQAYLCLYMCASSLMFIFLNKNVKVSF